MGARARELQLRAGDLAPGARGPVDRAHRPRARGDPRRLPRPRRATRCTRAARPRWWSRAPRVQGAGARSGRLLFGRLRAARRARDGALGARHESLRFAAQLALYAPLMAILAYFSTEPRFSVVAPDEALVRVSFIHATQRRQACRERTPEELAKLAPNMRAALDCPRERSPLLVEVELDGKLVLRREVQPRAAPRRQRRGVRAHGAARRPPPHRRPAARPPRVISTS